MKPAARNRRKINRQLKTKAAKAEKKPQGLSCSEGEKEEFGGTEGEVSSSLDNVSGDDNNEQVELNIGTESFLGFEDISVYNDDATEDANFSIGELPDLVGLCGNCSSFTCVVVDIYLIYFTILLYK